MNASGKLVSIKLAWGLARIGAWLCAMLAELHGALMFTAFGVLCPCAVWIARYEKQRLGYEVSGGALVLTVPS
jgi:hypothetical protein